MPSRVLPTLRWVVDASVIMRCNMSSRVLPTLRWVVDASVMMRCNMAVAAGDRAMVVVDASAMMRRNIINRNPPPKGTPIEKNTATEFGISGAKFTSEINQTTSEVVETTWEIVGTASTADENVLFPRARIHYNKLFFAFTAFTSSLSST